ncbi:hypothetical protein OROGR_015648 [Orobanche gracilis]
MVHTHTHTTFKNSKLDTLLFSSPSSQMVSLEENTVNTHQTAHKYFAVEPISGPRISFSSEFLNENDFISICPNREREGTSEGEIKPANARNPDFEFLSGNLTNMMTADELFCEGKLLPFWQTHQTEKLNKITLKPTGENVENRPEDKDLAGDDHRRRMSWFLDDDPSPRPPKCTVLWKELLRLKKQRASTLSPSSSSSSSSSGRSSAEIPSGDGRKKMVGSKEKVGGRVKKGLERTRSATTSIRIRPMVNVPICTQGKSSSLPPLFSSRIRRGRLD